MSGIGGIIRFSSAAGLQDDVGAMARSLACLYQDRTDIWVGDNAALCHALLHTVAEDRAIQPVEDVRNGRRIVCDSRLDNRPELVLSLAPEGESGAISDAELVLRAYERWGPDCPKKLLGDYAFVIYDLPAGQLFGARDPMGMRPLYYSSTPSEFLAFASTADALKQIPAVGASVNERRVADFLANLEGADLSSTFYEGVFRLPPAHRFTAGPAGLAITRFWTPNPRPLLQLPSNEAYVDAFLEVFTKAVRCRLRSAVPVASMLSGGVDSNAVAAVAEKLLEAEGRRLITISAVGPDPAGCVETAMIRHSLNVKDVDAHVVRHDELGANAKRLQQLTADVLEPFDATSIHNRSIYLAAHELGVRVVLDGVAGDIMLHPGNRVASLLSRGSFVRAWREAVAEASFWEGGGTAVTRFMASAWAAFAPHRLRRLKHDLAGVIRGRRIATPLGKIRPKFAKRSGLADRRRQYARYLNAPEPFGPAYLAKVLSHPNLTVGRERYQRIAAQLQIECRDPFTDLRLVEFCLSLPPEQFQDMGWPKILLRRALERHGLAKVAWRRGKTHLGPVFLAAYRSACGKVPSTAVPESLATYLVAVGTDGSMHSDEAAEQLESLGRWLERHAPNPSRRPVTVAVD